MNPLSICLTHQRHPEYPDQGRLQGAEICGDLGRLSGGASSVLPRAHTGALQMNIPGAP